MGLSNYPPGVTGNEPHITGEVELPATLEVTFTVTVTVHGNGRMDGEAVHFEAVKLARRMIVNDDPEVAVDSTYP